MNPYIELYWQVNPTTLHFKTNEQKQITGQILTDVLITNDTGKIIKEDHYIFETLPCNNANELATLNILELKRYFMLAGHVRIRLKLTDVNDTTNVYSYNDTFTVPPLSRSPFISDISFIDTFFESDVRTPFRKNGMQFIPLCQPFFDDYKGSLSYFSEIYYGNFISKTSYPLFRTVSISKKELAFEKAGFVKTDTIADSLNPYVYGSFPIQSLISGNYYLNVTISDRNNAPIARKSVFFQRYNKHPVANTIPSKATATKRDTSLQETINVIDLEKTFLKQYTLAQIKAMLKMLLPMSDQDGARAIQGFGKKPDEIYMRYFIYNYFSAIDKNKPERPWKAYSEKVKEVNKKFSKPGKIGYETDRGYMYLRYGTPSEVITVNNDRGALPYEIWQYNALQERSGKVANNAVMLFYKRNITDYDYTLLHTNISGELHNPSWRNFLYQEGDNNQTSELKAEFYIGNR
jgi:GWxTD domain-containing protein